MGESRRDHAGASGLLVRIGNTVRVLRKQRGLSRRALSEQSGVSPRYLAQLESGEGNISITLLSRVADALKCDIARLLEEQSAECFDELSERPVHKQVRRIIDLLYRCDDATRAQVADILEGSPGSREQRVCLVGLRGAGKSTLGAMAGMALGVPFIELNHQIEKVAGMPVAEIIALYGSDGYREYESKALDEVATNHRRVILAAAGGVVSEENTYQQLLARFHAVWLKASPSEHMQRVLAQGDTRPMSGNPAAMDQLKRLLKDREVDYARARYCVDTEGKPTDHSLQDLIGIIQTLIQRPARQILSDG